MESEPPSRLPGVQVRLQRLHGFRWLGGLLRFGQARPRGDVVSSNGGIASRMGTGVPEEKSDIFGVSIGKEAVDQAFWELAGEAIEKQRRRNSIDHPNQVYPPALRVGPQMNQDPRIWAADPRVLLPEGDPGRPAKLNSFSDPEYLEVVRAMLAHGIPGRDGQ